MSGPTAHAADDGSTTRIDVHAHFLPAAYEAALKRAGVDRLDGMPTGIPAWSVGEALRLMDNVGIGRSVLSISSPGVDLGRGAAAACDLSRRVNDAAAAIVAEHPDRFAFVASLPLPVIDAALEEIDRALGTLGAAGVVLLSHYQGHYLGDRMFAPVFEALNARRAVAVLHPTAPCQVNGSWTYPPPLLDFSFETTRTVVDLVLNRTLQRCPQVRVVVPHGGSALPLLVDRIERVAGILARAAGNEPVDVRSSLTRMWYDVAGCTPDGSLPALASIVSDDRLLYGSDFPFTPADRVAELSRMLATTPLLSSEQRERLYRDNALSLLAAHR